MDENILDLDLGLLDVRPKACFGSEGVFVVQKLEVVASKIGLFNSRQFGLDLK